MTFNPEVHHRRSIRLRDYDYSRAGAYSLTICTWQRECLFGEVVGGEMRLNSFGGIVQSCWDDMPDHFPHIELDTFVVMPNHVHGIIVINHPGLGRGVGAQFIAPDPVAPDNQAKPDNQGVMNRAPTVGEIVRAVKARCTHAINQTRDTLGILVWQRNYYERIIRNDQELALIRQYIADNPAKWTEDENHPARA